MSERYVGRLHALRRSSSALQRRPAPQNCVLTKRRRLAQVRVLDYLFAPFYTPCSDGFQIRRSVQTRFGIRHKVLREFCFFSPCTFIPIGLTVGSCARCRTTRHCTAHATVRPLTYSPCSQRMRAKSKTTTSRAASSTRRSEHSASRLRP